MKSFMKALLLSLCLLPLAHAEEYFHEEIDSIESFEAMDLLSQNKPGQVALRLNEKGWLKLLEMAMKFTAPGNQATYKVPANIYQFKIAKKMLLSNPVVPIIDGITNLGLREGGKDVPFYFQTSDISITGSVDKKSLKTEFSSTHKHGFDVSISLTLPKIVISSPQMSLCMDKVRGACSNELKLAIRNLRISTQTNPIHLKAKLRILNKRGVARVSLVSMTTNLEGKGAPTLYIDPKLDLIMPKMALEINGETTELDTSEWKAELIKQKSFLARELMSFAADFAGKNLARMINIYLVNAQFPTSHSWSLIDNIDSKKPFQEINFEDEFRIPNPIDSVYVMPRVDSNKVDFMQIMLEEIDRALSKAQATVSLTSISTPLGKDIELGGSIRLALNNIAVQVSDYIHNSDNRAVPIKVESKPYNPNHMARDNTYVKPVSIAYATNPIFLPKLNLSGYRHNDINVAFSEPVINGALDVVTSTGLFQAILAKAAKDSPELSLAKEKAVRLHFSQNRSISLILNVRVDLTKSRGFQSWVGRAIEWFNNSTQIYFPLEIQIIPSVKTVNGKANLVLDVKSPMGEKALVNSFGYPSNVPNMTNIVRSGLLSKINESIAEFVNKKYEIDISKYLNQSGVVFNPKTISFDQNAYMVMGLDLVDIKFNNLNPKRR